jgi:hypothetical protein
MPEPEQAINEAGEAPEDQDALFRALGERIREAAGKMSEEKDQDRMTTLEQLVIRMADLEATVYRVDATRQVQFGLSPLEKWLNERIIIYQEPGNSRFEGTLKDFGPGWVEIDRGMGPLLLFIGPGTLISSAKEV